LCHLCKHLTAPTESSTNWKGPVGNAFTTCETLPLSSAGIRCIPDGPSLSDTDLPDLSRDETYLYKMIKAVKTGLISSDLLREKPGPMSNVRWLTTADRICRLYVVTEEPSDELCTLKLFIVCYYGPMWYEIKTRVWCTDGAMHLLQMIKLLQKFPPSIKAVVWHVVQRNAYWTHPENVLLAVLTDADHDNCETAIDIINTTGLNSAVHPPHIREFRIPKISQSAQHLKDLLPAVQELKIEPPITKHLSVEKSTTSQKIPLFSHSLSFSRCKTVRQIGYKSF